MSEALEDDRALPALPVESMEGSTLIELDAAAAELVGELVGELGPVESPALELEPVTHENPNEAAAAPVESMEGAELVVEQAAPASSVDDGSSSAPVQTPPPAVVKLPRRPRLRASYWYDAQDRIVLELTLMDDRRNLIHREVVQPEDGGPLAAIFQALVGVAASAAHQAGVFGSRQPG